ncbi:hypothetical protein B0H17DRAFT_1208656 [Mycena rosella]|uniref:Uncharacterized protein n=1 Tax=Mycena rosella TaxID=1033263 RepID=A0AAD7G9E4_MYCRO|nr:hypothetical protein B0H17DRAFT_1208656 [Mycena rosella]
MYHAPRQRPAQAAASASPGLVFPSPPLSSLSDSSEFTLLEGSASSFVWSDLDDESLSHSQSESHPVSESSSSTSPPPVLRAPIADVAVDTPAQQPVPLLAFVASLLAVDHTTIQLLADPAHPPPDSPLFPGPPLAPAHPTPDADPPDTQHGLFRLLGAAAAF